MGNKINDPIARLMGLRYKSHPWHGIEGQPRKSEKIHKNIGLTLIVSLDDIFPKL